MKNLLLDANVLVRFLTQDDARQGAAATALFESAERREVVLHLEALTVAEAVYVLTGGYGRPRGAVANVLRAIIENAGVQTAEHGIVSDALQRFGATNVDFADAWLAARAAHFGFQVASFDRDLDRFNDIQRFDPKDAR